MAAPIASTSYAHALLFHRAEDRRVHDFFLARKYPSLVEVERILGAVATIDARTVIAARAIADASKVSARKVDVTLQALAARGLLSAIDGHFVAEEPRRAPGELAGIVAGFEALRARDRERVREMVAYGEHVACRWRQLRESFGEGVTADCGRCDVCCSQRLGRA